jgi:prepilin-type N-terminal cleavage/methylation domain-containing protein
VVTEQILLRELKKSLIVSIRYFRVRNATCIHVKSMEGGCMKKCEVMRNQKGFTLVELAIVLVIIGIILGAVLKGQEMINNAKIKRVASMEKEISAAVYSYYDKYGFYPGDDTNAAARFTNPAVTNGNGNGQIGSINFACAATGTEQCDLWSELRQANFIGGASGPSTFSNPRHAFGGAVSVGYATVQTLQAHWIGFGQVPFDVCQVLDTQMDDGNYLTGTVRGGGNYTAATSGSFDLYFKM